MTYIALSEAIKQVGRERITEGKVRSMDASEIVGWVHRLEDQVNSLEDAIAIKALPALEVLKSVINKDDRHIVDVVIGDLRAITKATQ